MEQKHNKSDSRHQLDTSNYMTQRKWNNETVNKKVLISH